MVSIITCTIRDEFINNVFENYQKQTWKDKELIIILNKDSMNIDKWMEKAANYQNVRVFQLHENAALGDCLNFGVLKAKHDIIAKFDDDDYYGPDYITTSMQAFKDEQVSILGKGSYYIYFKNKKALVFVSGEENTFSDTVAGASLMFRKSVSEKVQFEKVNRAEDYFFIDQCKKAGYKIYSTNRYHFAIVRHDAEKHTWKVSDEDFMGWGEIVAYKDELKDWFQITSKMKWILDRQAL